LTEGDKRQFATIMYAATRQLHGIGAAAIPRNRGNGRDGDISGNTAGMELGLRSRNRLTV